MASPGPQPDHYGLLGVSADASTDDIRKAYRRLAMIYHPDRQLTGDEVMFAAIAQAWEVLSDSRRRVEYNRIRGVHAKPAPRATARDVEGVPRRGKEESLRAFLKRLKPEERYAYILKNDPNFFTAKSVRVPPAAVVHPHQTVTPVRPTKLSHGFAEDQEAWAFKDSVAKYEEDEWMKRRRPTLSPKKRESGLIDI